MAFDVPLEAHSLTHAQLDPTRRFDRASLDRSGSCDIRRCRHTNELVAGGKAGALWACKGPEADDGQPSSQVIADQQAGRAQGVDPTHPWLQRWR